jgi:hypothetical protein
MRSFDLSRPGTVAVEALFHPLARLRPACRFAFRQYGRAARPAAAAGGQGPTPIAKRRLRWRQDRQPELHARGTGCEQAYHRRTFDQIRRTRRPQRDDRCGGR